MAPCAGRHSCRPQKFAGSAAAAVVLAGLLVLTGYAVGVKPLTGALHGDRPVSPLTAAALVLAGTGLLLVLSLDGRPWRHRIGRAAGGSVAMIAMTVLVEYATRTSIVDSVLFPGRVEQWAVDAVPGRPSLHMAAGLLLIGLSVAAFDSAMIRINPLGRMLVPASLLAGAMVIVGDLYGADYLRRGSADLPGTPLMAGVCLLALGAAITLSRPDHPPGHVFTGHGPGGRTMRGLAPSVATILVLAVLVTATSRSSLPIDAGFAVTAATGLVIASLYLLFLRTGADMDAADRKLREERDYVRTVLDSLQEGVITAAVDGMVLHVTPRWCEITGYPAGDVVGTRPPFPWWPPERTCNMTDLMDGQLASGRAREVDTQIVRPDGTRVDVLLTFCPVIGRDGITLRTATYRDLTERKAAEAERQRIADQVDHFFNMSGDLLCIADQDGYFRRLNPAWERTLGFTLDELTSRPYLDFIHPDDADRSIFGADAMIATGNRMTNFENRLRCRDGSYRWLSWSATLADRETMIYAVARDMTAQREAERVQAFLAAIVAGTDDAVIGKTLDGTIVSWNAAAERMYGYPAAEAIGRSIRMLALPGQFDEIEQVLAGLRRGGPVVHLEGVRRRADGTRLRVSLTISPIRDRNGRLVGAASIARDVTAQVAAEQRFRRLVQTAPDAMIIVDSAGRITLANDQTGRLFGYPSDELIGVPVEQLVPAGARGRHELHREHYLASPHKLIMGSGMELCGLRRDGSEFPIEISLAPLQTDEGIMISGAIRDISQRREVEHALASARDDALAAAKLKSQFVAMVSHEIRTPMNGVMGLTTLLLNTALNAEQRRYAEAIRTSGRALLTIINDILDFSKIEAGKISIVTAEFDLDELLDTVIEVAAEAGRGKDIDVICYYPPSLPIRVCGDAGRLRQTLLNLVGNAVKFTQHGHVILQAEPAPPDDAGVDRVTFTVTDTGVGIAVHDLPRLFEPFTQVDSATSREFGGTGLGLTISRQFVDLMGGELTALSKVGEGSRFTFTIRLPHATRHSDHPDSAFAGRSALVVDGHPVRRQFVVEHARSWGMTVTEASDDRHALTAFQAGAPEFVIVDDRVLATDGELGATLASGVSADLCRLVILTGTTDHTNSPPHAALGGHLLPKPVGVRRLLDCLGRPDVEPAADVNLPRPSDAGGIGRSRILLAEDNEINQMVAQDLLDLLGFDCDIAQNGTEVLSLATARPYRAILMDCQMPKMDGYAATAALRAREATGQHIPIIAMTAGALAEDRKQCFAAGMDDYLAKPIDQEALRAALERWTSDRPQPATRPDS